MISTILLALLTALAMAAPTPAAEPQIIEGNLCTIKATNIVQTTVNYGIAAPSVRNSGRLEVNRGSDNIWSSTDMPNSQTVSKDSTGLANDINWTADYSKYQAGFDSCSIQFGGLNAQGTTTYKTDGAFSSRTETGTCLIVFGC